jgi:hypothetical protein
MLQGLLIPGTGPQAPPLVATRPKYPSFVWKIKAADGSLEAFKSNLLPRIHSQVTAGAAALLVRHSQYAWRGCYQVATADPCTPMRCRVRSRVAALVQARQRKHHNQVVCYRGLSQWSPWRRSSPTRKQQQQQRQGRRAVLR